MISARLLIKQQIVSAEILFQKFLVTLHNKFKESQGGLRENTETMKCLTSLVEAVRQISETAQDGLVRSQRNADGRSITNCSDLEAAVNNLLNSDNSLATLKEMCIMIMWVGLDWQNQKKQREINNSFVEDFFIHKPLQ